MFKARKVITGFILTTALLAGIAGTADATEKNSIYDNVIKTNTLRCGYGIFPPFVEKDPNSGKIYGAVPDIMDEIGKALGIKIEYTEEIDWGQIAAALQSGRIDAMCAGMWGTAERGRVMAFAGPLYFTTLEAYVRADDQRFDNNAGRINQSDITIATNDGDVTEEIADTLFPKAQRFAKVQLAGEEFLLMNVMTGKADVTFTAPSIAAAFIEKNPGKLRQVPLEKPIRVYKNVIGIDIHEQALWHMLNNAIEQLHNSGSLDLILDKYQKNAPDMFRRRAQMYK